MQNLGLKRLADVPALIALDECLVYERMRLLGGQPALRIIGLVGEEGVEGAQGRAGARRGAMSACIMSCPLY